MLGHNPTQLDSYNKTTSGKGTLMANWFEERVHREQKGEGRTATKIHVPKRHQQLMTAQNFHVDDGGHDDTKYRILGDNNFPPVRPQNYHYGKGQNKADTFQKTGRKQQLLQKMYLQQVTTQIMQQQQKKAEQARKGIFETTHKSTFVQKPLNQNVIGRLNMYDQNGRTVQLFNVDQDLRQSNGFKQKGQITPDEELKKIIQTNVGFERQEPITFWRQKMEQGNYYMSKPGSTQPFAKNNQFLKTFQHYKHYRD